MKRKVAIIILSVNLILTCLLGLCACNGRNGDSLTLKTGSRPEYSTLIKQADAAKINAALSDNATEEQKKSAVMALYDVANYSRQNTNLSLMLQSSDAGISLGDVIMHGFNLKSGDAWYYQLAVEATSKSAFVNGWIGDIAGLLKIAYTSGDGNYFYTVVKGSASQCDCSVTTFPYATFKVTQQPKLYNTEQFKKELHYLNSMHEINNMKFCEDIIADGAKITYDAAQKFYRVEFSVDMNADSDLLKEWYALPKEDMAVGGQTLKGYNYYRAVLEVWDNGYAKSFQSESSRSAGMGSGDPIDKFEYIWNENEILELLKEDVGIKREIHFLMNSIGEYMEYYSNPEFAEAKLSKFKINCIIVGCVLGVLILAAIISKIVVEVLIKQGKLPKLAAKRDAKKQKRLEKKAQKNGEIGAQSPEDNEAAESIAGTDTDDKSDDNVFIE